MTQGRRHDQYSEPDTAMLTTSQRILDTGGGILGYFTFGLRIQCDQGQIRRRDVDVPQEGIVATRARPRLSHTRARRLHSLVNQFLCLFCPCQTLAMRNT